MEDIFNDLLGNMDFNEMLSETFNFKYQVQELKKVFELYNFYNFIYFSYKNEGIKFKIFFINFINETFSYLIIRNKFEECDNKI